MVIRYANGKSQEGILLARNENRMRVALKDGEDVAEFTEINGVWISEDCEPVQVEFAWQKKSKQAAVTEADCICSHELAARLIRLLLSGDSTETGEFPLLTVEDGNQGARLVM